MALSLPESLWASAQASYSEDMHTLALVFRKLRSDVVPSLASRTHVLTLQDEMGQQSHSIQGPSSPVACSNRQRCRLLGRASMRRD